MACRGQSYLVNGMPLIGSGEGHSSLLHHLQQAGAALTKPCLASEAGQQSKSRYSGVEAQRLIALTLTALAATRGSLSEMGEASYEEGQYEQERC